MFKELDVVMYSLAWFWAGGLSCGFIMFLVGREMLQRKIRKEFESRLDDMFRLDQEYLAKRSARQRASVGDTSTAFTEETEERRRIQ